MIAILKRWTALIALICVTTGPMMSSASAITAEVAKKCNALAAKAFPPRVPGNPAAGYAKGNGQSERDYFNKCVTNGGNVDDRSGTGAK